MQKRSGGLLVGAALAVMTCGEAPADFINGSSSGLSNLEQTITFEEINPNFPAPNAPVTNQFSAG